MASDKCECAFHSKNAEQNLWSLLQAALDLEKGEWDEEKGWSWGLHNAAEAIDGVEKYCEVSIPEAAKRLRALNIEFENYLESVHKTIGEPLTVITELEEPIEVAGMGKEPQDIAKHIATRIFDEVWGMKHKDGKYLGYTKESIYDQFNKPINLCHHEGK